MKRKVLRALGMLMAWTLTFTSVSVPVYAVDETVPVETEAEETTDEASENESISDDAAEGSGIIADDAADESSFEKEETEDEEAAEEASDEQEEAADEASEDESADETDDAAASESTEDEADAEILEEEEELSGDITTGELDNGVKFTVTNLSGGLTKVVVDAADSGVTQLDEYFYMSETYKDPDDPTKYYVYFDPTKVSELEIKGFTKLGESAIEADEDTGFISLSKLTLSNTITSIGQSAISGDNKLKKLVLPSSVRTIGNSAFACCELLEEIQLNDGLETIDRNAFYGCKNLRAIIIPDSVTKTGSISDDISDDTKLETVSIPISADTSTATQSLPKSVKKLILTKGTGEYNENFKAPTDNEYGFTYELEIGEGITTIPESMFYDIDNITKVTLPSTLTSVEDYAFEMCDELASVVFREGSGERVLTLGVGCFRDLKKLTQVDFPKDIVKIVTYAQPFYWSALKDVYFRNPKFTLHDKGDGYQYQIFSDGERTDAVILHAYPYDYAVDHGPSEPEMSASKLAEFTNKRENRTVYTFKSLGTAPKPVAVKSLSFNHSSEVRYEDDVAEDDKLELTVTLTPANADKPDIVVSYENENETTPVKGTDKSVYDRETGTYKVYAILTGDAGRAMITVRTNDDNLTTQLEAKCLILIKEKEKAMRPYVRLISGTGSDYGDQKGLVSQTPNAQIFYFLDNKTTAFPTVFDNAIEWDDTTGRFVSTNDKILEYTKPFVCGVDITGTTDYVHAVAAKKGMKISDILNKYMDYDVQDPWGDITDDDKDSEFHNDTDNLKDDAYKGIWAPKSQLFDDSIMYTGKAITIHDLRVYFGNKLLKSGTDYTLKYSDNVNKSNVAKIKVTLKGNYSGTATLEFRINPRLLEKDDLTWSVVQVNAKKNKAGDGYTQQYPDIKLKVKNTGKVLKPGTDYEISYKHNGSSTYGSGGIDTPGVYSVYVAEAFGYSNYTFPTAPEDRVYIDDVIFCIGGDKMVAMNKTTVSKIATQNMADWSAMGYTVKPTFTVKNKGTELKGCEPGDPDEDNCHYTYVFTNNEAAGTATLTLTGTNREVDGLIVNGTKVVTFKITGLPINKTTTTITGVNETYPFTGEEVIPTYKLTYAARELIEGVDYKVTYSKKGNINAGKVDITFTGTGIYAGKLKKSFKILPADAADLSIRNEEDYAWKEDKQIEYYHKGAVTPVLHVYFNGEPLTKGKDYTVSYANNKAVGSYDAEKKGKRVGPSATVKLKGNFKGSRTVFFSILQTDIGTLAMTANDIIVSKSPNKFGIKPVITDDNGAVLKAGTDYDKALTYTYDEDVEVTYKTGKGKNARVVSEIRSRGTNVEKTDIIPAGAVIRVTAKGINNYMYSISQTYTVAESGSKNLKFTIDPAKAYTYTGSVIAPTKDDIKVQKKEGKNWVDIPANEAVFYYDIIGYKNNIKAGNKAQIIIRTKNGYAGNVTVKFKIQKTAQK